MRNKQSLFFALGWHMKQNAQLQAWRNRCLPYLKFSGVYRRTTNDIRVTVISYYLGNGMDYHNDVAGTELPERNKSYVVSLLLVFLHLSGFLKPTFF
jgi:hypothetical protein